MIGKSFPLRRSPESTRRHEPHKTITITAAFDRNEFSGKCNMNQLLCYTLVSYFITLQRSLSAPPSLNAVPSTSADNSDHLDLSSISSSSSIPDNPFDQEVSLWFFTSLTGITTLLPQVPGSTARSSDDSNNDSNNDGTESEGPVENLYGELPAE